MRAISACFLLAVCAVAAAPLPTLRVSDNKHFLMAGDKPFYWLADTAWELFHRLSREEASLYLQNRADKGFNVIKAVALAEYGGLTIPNPYGHLPLTNNDPAQPNEAYFQHVDFIVRKANDLGLYIGFLPTWGDKWNKAWGEGPEIFTPANAEQYGEWLGKRYRETPGLIWILGGDRPVETDAHREILRAMARGIKRGDGGSHLMTLHPKGGQGSADFFHDEPWLDFNMRQNGHGPDYNGRYEKTLIDYNRTPAKPVIDDEAIYEDHPVNFKAADNGHSVAADVRRAMYWDLFSGAFGFTFGNHAVWQMWDPANPKHKPVNNPLLPWKQAIDQPGAGQMRHARNLLESRPFLTRIPDNSVIVADAVPTSVPGAGRYRFVATRDEEGSYAMVYAPVGRAFAVDLAKLSGARLEAWWFNPRTGAALRIGGFANTHQPRTFTPPDPGETLDWILVLDDAAKRYAAPGATKR